MNEVLKLNHKYFFVGLIVALLTLLLLHRCINVVKVLHKTLIQFTAIIPSLKLCYRSIYLLIFFFQSMYEFLLRRIVYDHSF